MSPRSARDVDELTGELDQIAHDVEMIVSSVRRLAAPVEDGQLSSLEADVLLRVARVRRGIDGLQPPPV